MGAAGTLWFLWCSGGAVPVGAVRSSLEIQLEAEALSPPIGSPVQIKAFLHNKSPDVAFVLARPVNGSDFRRQYPYCWWEVTGPGDHPANRLPVGPPTTLPPWTQQDFVRVAPGEMLCLTSDSPLSSPSLYYNLLAPGHYQVRLRYSYRRPSHNDETATGLFADQTTKQLASQAVETDLVSEPIALDIRPVVRLILAASREIPLNQAVNLADYFEILAENTGDRFLTLPVCDSNGGELNGGPRLFAWVQDGQGQALASAPMPANQASSLSSQLAETIILAPGGKQSIALPGARCLQTFEFFEPGIFTVQMAYSLALEDETQQQYFFVSEPAAISVGGNTIAMAGPKILGEHSHY